MLAKCAAHWIVTGLPLAVLAPLLGVAFGLDGARPRRGWALTLLVGTPTLSLIGGLAAALTLGARRCGALLALLALPLCVPTLIFGAWAVEAVATGEGFAVHIAILARLGADGPGHPAVGDCRGIAASGRVIRETAMAQLHFLANPARFRRFCRARLPVLGVVTALALAVGLWLALVVAPPDYQQGETVRIMYIHVPAAWIADGRATCCWRRSAPRCWSGAIRWPR